MTILLVRHGETAGNASRILQRPDAPLNERGVGQAEQLARRLFDDGFVHVICSDLRGVPYAELKENPFGPDFAPPNGEDWPTFHARVAEAFDFIVSRRRRVN